MRNILGAPADHARLQLGNGHHLLQQEAAGPTVDLRQIGKAHVNASFEQPQQESDRARQPI